MKITNIVGSPRLKSKLPEGKKALFVQTQGADEEMFKEIYEKDHADNR